MKHLLLCLLGLTLLGCSQANTRGDQYVREYNIKIKNTGYLYIYTPLEVDAKSVAGTKIDTDNDPSTRPNLNASIAGQGATATGAVGETAKVLLDGAKSVYDELHKDDHTTNNETYNEQEASNEPEASNEQAEVPDSDEQAEVPDDTYPKPIILDDEEDETKPAAFNLNEVTWLHTDVSEWPVTSKLKAVTINGNRITLDYDAANKWPGRGVVANPWIFVKQDGKWYAATWEWLRPGQTTKALYAVSGSHIKRDPLRNFKPVKGETYGFMVSGLARDAKRNVKERTNILWIKWPK